MKNTVFSPIPTCGHPDAETKCGCCPAVACDDCSESAWVSCEACSCWICDDCQHKSASRTVTNDKPYGSRTRYEYHCAACHAKQTRALETLKLELSEIAARIERGDWLDEITDSLSSATQRAIDSGGL